MTGAEFEAALRRACREAARSRPETRAQDAVKFLFQGMLGPGHLIPSREAAEARAAREMAALAPDPEEPLFEPLSPAWCRMNLGRALAERLTPAAVAAMMTFPVRDAGFSRADVLAVCRRMAESGAVELPDEALAGITDEGWLPSHSEEYRKAYRPAYRVVPAFWMECGPALTAAARAVSMGGRRVVTIDGPCASGKTTLAGRLARVFLAALAHTDDFVVPHAEKTAERLSRPGGNCDEERLLREVLRPWKEGKAVLYRRYDCGADAILPGKRLPDADLLILEGSYANLPGLRDCADARIFLEMPWETRERRLLARETPESMGRYRARWIPLEDAYFDAYALPDEGCVLCRTESPSTL